MKTMTDTRDRVDALADGIDQGVRSGVAAAEAARDFIEDYGTRVGDSVRDAAERGMRKLRQSSAQLERSAKNNPKAFLAGAAAVGFVLGAILCRRR